MQSIHQLNISHQSAIALTQAAVDYASANNMAIAACVVDVHGRTIALQVMNGASLIADELVIRKAKTALLGLSSADFASAVSNDASVESSMLALDSMTLLGGGYPLLDDGVVIGGFAVGGATVEMDMACAEAALNVVNNQ